MRCSRRVTSAPTSRSGCVSWLCPVVCPVVDIYTNSATNKDQDHRPHPKSTHTISSDPPPLDTYDPPTQDINPAGANPKPLYLCSELELEPEGVFVPTERGTVVVKAARLHTDEELETVTAGRSVAARRRGADEPAEEAKAMALLTKGVKDEDGPTPSVVPLLDCFVDGDRWLYMVLPYYARGDLVEVLGGIAQQGQLGSLASLRWARSVFGQLVESLALLKRRGVAHLDLSPENVFMEETGASPALGDFGMALCVPTAGEKGENGENDEEEDAPRTPAKTATNNKTAATGAGALEEDEEEGERKKWERDEQQQQQPQQQAAAAPPVLLTAQPFRGKVAYAAPELVLEQPFDPFAADIFSLGCTLFALLAGRLLLEPASSAKQKGATTTNYNGGGPRGALRGRPRFAALLRREWSTLFELHKSNFQLPPLAAELIQGMIEPDPRKRLTLEEVAAHPWVQGV
jgi:serine/threonine protein kinase